MSDISVFYSAGETGQITKQQQGSDIVAEALPKQPEQQIETENLLTSVIIEYYGTNDAQEEPDGTELTWSTTVPGDKPYIWLRVKQVYQDGTEIISAPQLNENNTKDSTPLNPTVPQVTPVSGTVQTATSTTEEFGDEAIDFVQDEPDQTNVVIPQVPADYGQNEAFLTQSAIFDLLTQGGSQNGIFYYAPPDQQGNRQLYINSTFVRSGTIQVGGSQNQLGVFMVLDANNNIIWFS